MGKASAALMALAQPRLLAILKADSTQSQRCIDDSAAGAVGSESESRFVGKVTAALMALAQAQSVANLKADSSSKSHLHW